MNCKRHMSLTAGTFFERVRNIRAWFSAIWLFEHGVMVNSSFLSALTGLAYSSALNLTRSILDATAATKCGECKQFSSSHFSFVFARRSLASPMWLHPCYEENAERFSEQSFNTESAEEFVDCEFEAQDIDQATPASSDLRVLDVAEQLKQDEDHQLASEESLTELESQVLAAIADGYDEIDSVCTKLEVSIADVNSTVAMLQIYGLVDSLPGCKLKVRDSQSRRGDSDSFGTIECSIAIGKPKCLNKLCSGRLQSEKHESLERSCFEFMELLVDFCRRISRKYLYVYAGLIHIVSNSRQFVLPSPIIGSNFFNSSLQVSSELEDLSGKSRASGYVFASCLARGYMGSVKMRKSRTATVLSICMKR
ncbi:MAG: hypothetical protein K2Y32_16660 [Candidatus Obscuribacterales bacterium]|nr:hypothetical protein [Candidatus Obscuribacterales bacterium]